MLAFLALNAKKVLGGLAMAGLALFLAFQWGKADMRAKVAEALAQAEREWSVKVTAASQSAYDRGLEDARKDIENERTLDDIVRAAEGEVGADDLCLSADIVERLRQLE